MTLQETKEVLAVVASSFPKYFSNISRASAERNVILWHEDLGEYSMATVMAGVKAYRTADNSGFPPSTGQVITYIHMIGNPVDRSGTEAWALVRRAVNCPWDQIEASYGTLPKNVQKAVGSAASLREMAMMDVQKFETVAQSNFLRMYDAVQKREAVEQRMSNSVIGARDSVRRELEMRRPDRGLLPGGENKAISGGVADGGKESPKLSDEKRSEYMAELRRRLGG